MFVRLGNPYFESIMDQYKESNPLLIYLMWSGYIEENEKIQHSFKKYRNEILHTSGHANFSTVEKVVGIINPKVLISIHTNQASEFSDIRTSTIYPNDGEIITV